MSFLSRARRAGLARSAPRRRWRLLVALVVLAALTEVGLRVVTSPPTYLGDMPFDPELGFRSPPNVRCETADEDGWFLFEKNEAGFRGPPPAASTTASGARILFIGDSFLQGWQVREDALIPFSAEAALRAAGHDVTCFSAACNGYGTAQEVLLLRRWLPRNRPDVVVLCFFTGNDVADNALELAGSGALNPGGYVRPFLVPAEGSWRRTWMHPVRASLRGASRTFQLVEHRMLMSGWIDGRERPRGEREPGRLPFAHLNLFAREPEPVWEEAWRLTLGLLGEVRREVADAGARLLVAVIPHKLGVLHDARSREMRESAERALGNADWSSWNAPETRLAPELANAGIPSLLLLDELRGVARGERRSPYQLDGHLNSRGHRAAGRAVARALEALLDETGGEDDARLTPVAPVGAPVDLPALVYGVTTVLDFTREPHPEMIGAGWHGWYHRFRGPWHPDGQGPPPAGVVEAGWHMAARGKVLVANAPGELVMRGWLPDVARVPVTVTVDGVKHELTSAGAFELHQPVQVHADTGVVRTLRIQTSRSFLGRGGRQMGLVLQALGVEP